MTIENAPVHRGGKSNIDGRPKSTTCFSLHRVGLSVESWRPDAGDGLRLSSGTYVLEFCGADTAPSPAQYVMNSTLEAEPIRFSCGVLDLRREGLLLAA
jgi:hypothetical protein